MMFNFLLCEAGSNVPWWIGVITGSGGLAVGASWAVIALWRAIQTKDKENNELAREAIQTIATAIERSKQDEQRQKEIKEGIDNLMSHVFEKTADDKIWKQQLIAKIDSMLGQ